MSYQLPAGSILKAGSWKLVAGSYLRLRSAATATTSAASAAAFRSRRCTGATRRAVRRLGRLARAASGRRPAVEGGTVLVQSAISAQNVACLELRAGVPVELAGFDGCVVHADHQILVPIVVLAESGEPRKVRIAL